MRIPMRSSASRNEIGSGYIAERDAPRPTYMRMPALCRLYVFPVYARMYACMHLLCRVCVPYARSIKQVSA